MRKLTLSIVSLTSALVILSLFSCKKYPDGPLLSLKSKEKRIMRTWVLDKYYRNGSDETGTIHITSLTETFSNNKAYSRSYTDKNGKLQIDDGQWSFDSKKETVDLSGPSSIDLSPNTSSVSSSRLYIQRLTSEEFWYSYDNGGDTHEFHMKAQ